MSGLLFEEREFTAPATDRDLRLRSECADADHPPRCYNPSTETTACWCGKRWYAGNVAPDHAVAVERVTRRMYAVREPAVTT